ALDPANDNIVARQARDLTGTRVLSAHAPIELREDRDGRKREPLGWKVFVEQPLTEVYAGLQATVWRTIGLIVAGLLFSVLAAMWLAGAMVRPIRTLQQGAQRIGEGDLETQIDVHTRDELQGLAEQFNRMTAQLRESYAGLERKVEERTSELKETLEQQTATSGILEVMSGSPTDVQPVFDAIVRSGARLFSGAGVAIALPVDGQVRIASIADEDPERCESWKASYPFPLSRDYMHATAILDRRVIDVPDALDPPAEWSAGIKNFVRTGYRAITIVPLSRGETVFGTVSVVRMAPGPLTDKQL